MARANPAQAARLAREARRGSGLGWIAPTGTARRSVRFLDIVRPLTTPRLAVSILAAVACTLLLAPPSVAKSPPEGKYECTIEGLLFGTLKIVNKDSYKRNGTKGSYKAGDKKISFPDGFKGWKLKFEKGSFDGFKGRWYKTSSGVSEIALESPEDGFENIYCDEH